MREIIIVFLIIASISFADNIHLYNEGLELYRAGEYQKAIDVLKNIVHDEDFFKSSFYIVQSYIQLGDFTGSLKYWDILVERFPENGGFFLGRGAAEYYSRFFREAEKDFERAVSLDPLMSDAWLFLGLSKIVSGKYSEAKTSFLKGQKLNPQDFASIYYAHLPVGKYKDIQQTETKYLDGDKLIFRKKFQKAHIFYTTALETNPGNFYLKIKQFMCSYKNGDVETSLKEVNNYLEDYPDESHILVFKANILNVLKRYKESILVLEEITKKNPEWAYPQYVLGESFFQLNQWDISKLHFQRALEIDPQNAIYNAGMATACYKLGDLNNAVVYMSRAHLLKPQEEDFCADLHHYVDEALKIYLGTK